MYEYITNAEVGDTILIPSELVPDIIGWEFYKSAIVVGYMVEALERGDKFPPVPIQILSDGSLFLSQEACLYDKNGLPICDGGHHRALAYYITCNCLPVTIVNKPGELYSKCLIVRPWNVRIKEIILSDTNLSHEYKMDNDPKYRASVHQIDGVPNTEQYIDDEWI